MASRIEQIIEEIEEYIDGCKPQTFSSSKIIVNREEMEELLNELRIKTPEEIKRYQKIISNKGSNSGRCPGRCDHRTGAGQDGRAGQRTLDHAGHMRRR